MVQLIVFIGIYGIRLDIPKPGALPGCATPRHCIFKDIGRNHEDPFLELIIYINKAGRASMQ